jgi:serine/threonine-protein kinase haspin
MPLSGFVVDSAVNDYVHPILKEALSPIAAQGIQKFDSWASHSADMFDVAKLAEGSFGDVYKLHLREEACRPVVSKSKLARLKSYGDGVFKVMPLRAKSGVGSKKHTSIDDIVAEVKMLKYLDPVPGFARFREIHVVQGRYPASFQYAWDQYKKTKKDVLNPNPASKRAYPDTQIWVILEMDDAGHELEKFAWSSIFQIYDIFWGVAMALARAELFAMFEHRDLHLGNVCIRSTRDDGCLDPPTELDIARHSSSSGFGISTLQTTIIDYTLSRAELLQGDDPANLAKVVAFTDLDKQQIFDGIGQDEDEVMQRNTYR